MTECECLFSLVVIGTTLIRDVGGVDVATRWYRAPEIMLSFANYVGVVRRVIPEQIADIACFPSTDR